MTFKCALCGDEFIGDTPDEEARAECKELFGVDPDDGGCDVVCDPCFQRMQREYPISQFLKEYN